MYLKRLEIRGFKSFADKTVVDLQKGLNTVVGPNGSGKSNISDAVLWVLGEQSARTLRGSRMEDVIFSGSSTRRPLGMAEVILILDNSDGTLPLDYQEVSIKRRLYRTGDSEYFINNTICRLKDIHDLLVDTGLGKEAYSLIGQGRIDEVLSVRGEDRRAVVDDAAGIVKYKNRKKEAARKLDETRQNSIRVQDILAELEAQLEPLAHEAEKAARYLIYKTEADELEISMAASSIRRLALDLNEHKDRRDKKQNDWTSMEADIADTETKLENTQLHLVEVEQVLEDKLKELYQHQSQLERTETDLIHNAEQVESLSSQKEKLQGDIRDLATESSESEERIRELKDSLEQVRTSLRELEDVLSLENHSYEEVLREIGSREMDLEARKDLLLDQMNRAAEMRHQIRSLEQDITRLDSEKLRKEKEKVRLNEEIELLAADRKKIADSLAGNQEKSNRQVNILRDLESKKDICTKKINALNQDRTLLEQEVSQMDSRLHLLEEMIKDYEGYHKGVRSVLTAAKKNRLKGVCGVVSELFSTEARYEQAVATALGATLQNIVTESSKDAEDAIAMLKTTSGGRSTFLPLDVIQPHRRSELLLMMSKENGILGLASDLVQTDERYNPIKEYLLGQIVVASELEYAQQAARKSQFRIRFVTLDGDMISPGGAMSGGSRVGNQASLLGRDREVNELKVSLEHVRKKRSQCSEKIRKSQDELSTMEKQWVAESKIRDDLSIVIAESNKRLEQNEYQKIQLDKQHQIIQTEMQDIDGMKADSLQKMDRLNHELAGEQERTTQMEMEISQLQLQLEGEIRAKEDITSKVTENKVTLATVRQKEAGLLDQVRVQEQILKGYRDRRDRTSGELKTLEMRMATLADKHVELEKLKDRLMKKKMEMDAEAAKIRHQRQALSDGIADTERRVKRVRRRAGDAQTEIHQLDMDIARREMEIDSLAQKLQQQFGLTSEAAALRVTKIHDEDEAKATLQILRDYMDALGTVQLGAVEEQRRVLERYRFLNTQYADLEEAQRGLQQVIHEIDKVMKKKFLETFNRIRISFNDVVHRLFEGGKGDLILTDPDNPLDSGLEITVQPPGKKLQNLTLMSGGEKALTAISLLFAVLLTRPASFCVLDEIDTSLDEANVDRFAAFLRELVRDTQFIVVTHRKGTMETADVMYGVTMEESGVSKLISVRFAESAVS